ncbi:YkvA family protein [Consotaella salsifontis]|uniref:Uncharacterized membrane protein YkvA, DUF1232 family n=1 Tax=Consotaella salsifontis TaxID=1365950 RepID=A0A1T4RZW8_9HYPH|nr:YkvA family protein [Consotaella salsifontis]SKA21081.1 Uncharacterized membrane protein YkvA, DUF1232 family [Consotaella salsifontis]
MDKARIGEILVPGNPEEQERQESRVRASFFETVRRALRYIPFIEDVVAAYYCAIDRQTPASTRGILLAALAYFVIPMDLIPDFLLGLGFSDDLAVLWAAFSAVRQNIKPEHYEQARETLGDLRRTA